MTTAEDPAVPLDASGDPERPPAFVRSLWFHALLLGVVLVALVPVLDNGSIAVVDEAVYSYQAANLADGSWASPRPLPRIATTPRDGALIDSVIKGDEWIPYSRQPLYPILLAPLVRVGGYGASILLAVLGTWIAAVSAAAIAGSIDTRTRVPTLWLTGVGTPLLFYSNLVVGHAPAAGAAGVCAYALLRWSATSPPGSQTLTRTSNALWGLIAVGGAVVLVLLRSEGAILVGSLAVVGTLLGVQVQNRRFQVDWPRVVPPLVVGGAGVVAFLANDRWARQITGDAGATTAGIDRGSDPLNVAWLSLIRPWGADSVRPSVLVVLAILCTIIAAIALRLLADRPFIAVAMLCTAAVLSMSRLFGHPALISGLVVTVPAVAFGLLLVGRQEWSGHTVRLLLGASVAAALGILWFSYGEGSGPEWGGRFFLVVVPLLVPVAVLSIMGRIDGLPAGDRMAILVALVVMTLSAAVMSLRSLDALREFNLDVVDEAVVASSSLPQGAPVVVAPISQTSMSRLFWADARRGVPIINGGNPVTFTHLLPAIGDRKIQQFGLITDTSAENIQFSIDVGQSQLGLREEWTVSEPRRLGRTGYVMYTIGRT